MIIELQKLLAGIINTLEEEVGPDVAPGKARAQFYSCLDLLNNLAAKLDWNRSLLSTEIAGVEDTLRLTLPLVEKVAGSRRGGGAEFSTLASNIAGVLAEEAADGELFARRVRLNEVLEEAIARINAPGAEDGLDEDGREAIEQAAATLREHLRNQTLRDAMYLKPMMLGKISQG